MDTERHDFELCVCKAFKTRVLCCFWLGSFEAVVAERTNEMHKVPKFHRNKTKAREKVYVRDSVSHEESVAEG